MIKFCVFCARKLDAEGFCTNPKCPDFKRKLIVETEKNEALENNKSTNGANNDKA